LMAEVMEKTPVRQRKKTVWLDAAWSCMQIRCREVILSLIQELNSILCLIQDFFLFVYFQ